MRHNGLGIGEEWEFGKQMLISVPKFNGGKMLKCSSSAHFLPIPCYAFALFLALIFSKLETILKRNKKYFEKSLQVKKIGCIFVSDKQLIISLNDKKMKVSLKTTQLLEASVLGTLAFKNGIKRAPALDKELYKFFGGKIGERKKGEASSIEIMKAWTNAWDNANLANAFETCNFSNKL